MELERKYGALLAEIRRRGQGQDEAAIRLCFELLSLASAIDRDCAAHLAPYGLSEGRFVLLFLLDGAEDGLSPRDLAERAGVTPATITGLLDGLERDGLIVRTPDGQDRRKVRIRLTDAGRDVGARAFARHGGWIAGLFSDLSVADRAGLGRALAQVRAQVGGGPAGRERKSGAGPSGAGA